MSAQMAAGDLGAGADLGEEHPASGYVRSEPAVTRSVGWGLVGGLRQVGLGAASPKEPRLARVRCGAVDQPQRAVVEWHQGGAGPDGCGESSRCPLWRAVARAASAIGEVAVSGPWTALCGDGIDSAVMATPPTLRTTASGMGWFRVVAWKRRGGRPASRMDTRVTIGPPQRLCDSGRAGVMAGLPPRLMPGSGDRASRPAGLGLQTSGWARWASQARAVRP
jgi:hypothetical protein